MTVECKGRVRGNAISPEEAKAPLRYTLDLSGYSDYPSRLEILRRMIEIEAHSLTWKSTQLEVTGMPAFRALMTVSHHELSRVCEGLNAEYYHDEWECRAYRIDDHTVMKIENWWNKQCQ